jgi:caffeoyl-CoA O-methyltransferase
VDKKELPMASSKSFAALNPALEKYVVDVFSPRDKFLEEIVTKNHSQALPPIEVNPMDGLHLQTLIAATGAKKVIEIGTLGGVSAIHIARTLPENGHLHTLEFHPRHARAAQENLRLAGVHEKVTVHVGRAQDILPTLEKQGPFDFVFIDADKESYPAYAKWCAKHLRLGGTLLADNTFAWGLVLQEKIENPDHARAAQGIREFNMFMAQSGHFASTLLPTGEGLTLGVRCR